MNFVSRRVLLAVAQIAALSFLAFMLSSAVPGDVLWEARLDPQIRDGGGGQSLDRLREQMHLDRPWPRRYAEWLGNAMRGDWGTSLSYGIPVSDLLRPRLPRTLEIVLPAWLMSWALGLLAAAVSVRFKLSRPLEGMAATMQMIPEVILASITTWVLLVYWKFEVASAWLLLVPMTFGLGPTVFLHAVGALSIARESRFVNLARVARVDARTLWLRFVLPAAANPLISLMGPTLVAAFGSSLVVEAVTGWPGVGTLFLDAFRNRDYPVTQAVLLLLGAMLSVTNLAADLLLHRLDPRIGDEESDAAA